MVEYKDATEEERAVRLCNSGMMAVRSSDLFRWLAKVGNDNAAGEYYLPDIVNIAAAEGRDAVVIEGDPYETAGVNSRAELAHLELEWQRRRREQALVEGATLIDPESVWFAYDTKLGRDVTVEPHVVFGPGVEIADGATIHAFSHIEGAMIGVKASIGPFARIRPGTRLAAKTKVGNFVELKKAEVAEGAKVNHLSYVGDASVGARANIGAGTITCNYDGFRKYGTVIGEDAFIGSNSALVAPVTVGDGAIVGAGSVITRDVEADSLALERNEQKGIAGWARRFRERMTRKAAEPQRSRARGGTVDLRNAQRLAEPKFARWNEANEAEAQSLRREIVSLGREAINAAAGLDTPGVYLFCQIQTENTSPLVYVGVAQGRRSTEGRTGRERLSDYFVKQYSILDRTLADLDEASALKRILQRLRAAMPNSPEAVLPGYADQHLKSRRISRADTVLFSPPPISGRLEPIETVLICTAHRLQVDELVNAKQLVLPELIPEEIVQAAQEVVSNWAQLGLPKDLSKRWYEELVGLAA
jgi:acetyltransferase-like isoleucine patch superfamily enzyme